MVRKFAVIGSGISGLTSSYYLLKNPNIEIDLYEKEDRIGGHSHTISVDNEKIDIGFQVFNHKTYPNMLRLFNELNIELIESNMSFGVFDNYFEWGGNTLLSIIFSLLNYKFWILLWNLWKFFKDANQYINEIENSTKTNINIDMTISQFCDKNNYHSIFKKYYLIPFCSAVWSMGENDCGDTNAYFIFRFMKNHSLLQFQNEKWFTLKNRSEDYVNKILDANESTQRFTIIKEEVINIEKGEIQNIIYTKNRERSYDYIIVAVNCHQVYPLLKNSSLHTNDIENAFSNFLSTSNKVTVHKDSKVMAKNRHLWCSWNTQINSDGSKPITSYWFQNLQSIKNSENVFLTLNSPDVLKNTIVEYTLHHPKFDSQSEKYKRMIKNLQGENNLYFVGAYLHNGFHEDGVNSAISVVNTINSQTTGEIKKNTYQIRSLNIHQGSTIINCLFFQIFLRIIKNTLKIGNIQIFYKGYIYKIINSNETPINLYIENDLFFQLIIMKQDLGFAESYIHKYIDTENLFGLLELFIKNKAIDNNSIYSLLPFTYIGRIYDIIHHRLNHNSIKNSKTNIQKHYDLSNELYTRFLDKSMTYSCAFFQGLTPTIENLCEAQQNKYNRITRKMEIDFDNNPTILEIGCGWGGYAKSLINISDNKSFSYTGITISLEQYNYCIELFRNEPRIKFVLIDYREITGEFDYVVSIEMIEAVGVEYLHQYFQVINNRLNKTGKAMIQAITIPDDRYENYKNDVDFIQKYIFPGGICPSIGNIVENSKKNNLIMVDMNNFHLDYTHTLLLWLENFRMNYDEIRKFGFDDYFYKVWEYYLIYCAVGFKCKMINLNQILFQKY